MGIIVFFSLSSTPFPSYYPTLQRYTQEHLQQDPLIVGFASEKANPFREKTWSCELI